MVNERPREGTWAWLRRRIPYVADPEPVEVVYTRVHEGVPLRDLELLAAYAALELRMPWLEME